LTRTQRHLEAFRTGEACIQVRDASGRPLANTPVSVEQESHAFLFGCVVPDLTAFSDADQDRYRARLEEVFNRLLSTRLPSSEPGVLRVEVAERIHLGLLRLRLDQFAAPGQQLHVHVWGETAGMSASADSGSLSDRDVGRRVAELYTLCFSHPAVGGLFWNGFADGQSDVRGGGLLRRDLAPKYAHKVLQKLIGSLWHTRAEGLTDAHGLFRFRGFFGGYRVVANVRDSPALVQTITFHRGLGERVASELSV
jgi:hypothetical protein